MNIHNPCALYTIQVIRAVMNGQTVPPVPGEVPYQELFSFAKLHNVEALVWYGLCEQELDFADPVLQDWENRVNMLLAQGIVQLADRDIVLDGLTAAGIPVLPVKGCWLKELYPNMEYRQMSDLDMLIPREMAQKAREVMLALGYTTDSFEDSINHAGYLKPPYTEVELHVQLLEDDGGYYDDVWQRAKAAEGNPCLHRFSREDEYIYYIAHIHKHLEDAGIGIRSVLDSLVYRDAWQDMDWAYMEQELKKLGMWELARNVQRLCDCWFRSGESLPEELKAMASGMLSSGSYGTMENRSAKRLEKLEQKYPNPVVRGLVYWVIQICAPLDQMQRSFPILRKLPVLLPVFWIYRAVMRVVSRPGHIWNHVKIVFGKGKDHG